MTGPNCSVCKRKLAWKMPYKKGERPINQDGSIHYNSDGSCKKREAHCKYCPDNFGWFFSNAKMSEHIRTYHPNGEKLFIRPVL